MGFYENGIEGLIIENNGEIELQEEFTLTLEKVEELLDKIIPLDNRKFLILSSYFCSLDMTGGKTRTEIKKDDLIDKLKSKIYVVKMCNINERMLRKYEIKELILYDCKKNIEIPDFIENLQISYCKVDKLPNSVKSLKLIEIDNIVLPEFLEKLETDNYIDILPKTLKELKLNVRNKIPLDNLPNLRKLELHSSCIQQLDFLPNTLEELIIKISRRGEQELLNLPNSIRILCLRNVKRVIIPNNVLDIDIKIAEKVIIPINVKKINLDRIREIIFLDDKYDFKKVVIECDKHTKIVNLPKDLKIDIEEIFDNTYQIITLK